MACSTPLPSTRQLSRNVSTIERSTSSFIQHDTDEPVISEPIGHPDHQAACVVTRQKVSTAVSERRIVVKLNWFVLNVNCDTRPKSAAVGSAIATRSSSPLMNSLSDSCFRLFSRAAFCRYMLGAVSIVFARPRSVECPDVVQEPGDGVAVLRQSQGQDVRGNRSRLLRTQRDCRRRR